MFRIQRLVVFALVALGLLFHTLQTQQAQQANPPKGQTTPPASPQTQDPAQQNQDVVRINTQLVQVDVVVTDKKGRHAEDLTQADFKLLVDGKEQPLTHFSHYNLKGAVARELPQKKKGEKVAAAPEAMPTRQLEPKEVQRTIAFIVDDLGLSFTSAERTRETLRKFVAEQMQEGDFVAIIRTGNGLGLLEQFTSDKRVLYAAIEKLAWNPLSRDMNPSFADSTAEVSDDQAARQAAVNVFEDFRQSNFTTGTVGAISFVVQGLRNLPGRKSVILLSDGFTVYNQNDDPNITEQIVQAMKNLVEQASRASVVIYAIDAKGLQPFQPGGETGGKPSASAYSDATQAALEALDGPVFLAKETGGFVVTNSNDLNIGVQEAIYDQQSYYLIGFDPDDAQFDTKFHKISVKVNRPGVTVRTRSGFYGVKEDEQLVTPKSRGEQLLAGLLSPMGVRELPLKMTPYFFSPANGRPLVRTLFHLDASKLNFKDGPNGEKLLKLELATFAFDETGAAADLSVNRLNLSYNEKQYKQVLAEGLAYRRDFQLKKPGAYQFRAVLRDDESGRTGSASQFIQVPDLSKQRLAMSGLVLTAPKQVAAPSAPSSDAAAASEAAVTLTPAEKAAAESTPTSGLPTSPFVRKFPRNGWIQYGAAIYNATTDKKTSQTQITVQTEIYRDGKAVYQFPARPVEFTAGMNPKRFDYVGRLRLNNLPAGAYLLRMVVTDGLAKKNARRVEQWMDFTVE
jgi:VWFA-related protein